MKRLITIAAAAGALALLLTGCGPSKDQQLEQAALDYAQTVSEKTPDAACEGFQGDALVDREGWEDIAIDTVAAEPTNAGEYIVGLTYTKGGDEHAARVWVAPEGDGFCVRTAADGNP